MGRLFRTSNDNYKLFYNYEKDEAQKMADEKGWKILFLTEESGVGVCYIVYKDSDSIDMEWLKKVVKDKEQIKQGNINKEAATEVTYIATAPIRFTVSPTQGGKPYDDDGIGPSFFAELKNAVSSSMSEMGPTGLAQYIDPQYNKLEEGLITSIIVDAESQGNKIVSKTTIKASRELTDEELENVKDYINGQFSDGWGEGFEQQAIADWDEEEEDEEWDEDEQEYYKNTYTKTYELFAHFWSHKDGWNIDIKRG